MEATRTWLVVMAVGILAIPQITAEELRYARSRVDPDETGYWWFQSAENWWTNAQYSVGAPNPAHFPTKDDDVYVNSALLTDPSKPLYIKDGDVVETKALTINYGRFSWGSSGLWQYFDFNGGTMVNYGNVVIGSGGGTGYGYAHVNFKRGVWDVRGELQIGSAVNGQPMTMGVLNISSDAKLIVTNGNFDLGYWNGFATGIVTNEGMVLYKDLILCPGGTQHGLYVMRGGTNYNTACKSSGVSVLTVGNDNSGSAGVIRGWGYWDRGGDTGKNAGNINMMMHGQVIADGEGSERDMDMGWFRTVNAGDTSESNVSGTNGWFAVNKGRLVYPHRQELTPADKRSVNVTVGDGRKNQTWDSPSDVVNTVRLKGSMLSTYVGYGAWPYAQLYASDRSDIPDLTPVRPKHPKGRWLGVFRLGFFSGAKNPNVNPTSGNVSFEKMSLKIRYDHIGLKVNRNPKITLYRYDGTNGWVEQTTQIHDSESPYISVEDLAPRTVTSSDKWNLGWFAIKADYELTGLVLLFR